MDLKQIEKLIVAMESSKIKRIVLKKEDFEIEIERECAPPSAYHGVDYAAASAQHQPSIHTMTTLPRVAAEVEPTPAHQEEKPSGIPIPSPMVGTFYSSPSPDDPPFVKVGDSINEDTVVCIVEAMKVMNEVKAGVKGVVSQCLLKSGEPVEFGTPMFRVTSG